MSRRRDIKLVVWVNQNELDAIDASAEVNAVSRGEYMRACSIGRPVKARNRLFRAERALERKRLREEAEDRQREQERAASQAADKRNLEMAKGLERLRKRKEKAEALIMASGLGAQGWWDSLSARKREDFADVIDGLLVAEEAATVWETERCAERLQAPAAMPAPKRWRPPTVPPGCVQPAPSIDRGGPKWAPPSIGGDPLYLPGEQENGLIDD
jgi:hypothetical protein